MPIYFVVWESTYHPPYQIKLIVHVEECTLQDINDAWQKYVMPLQNQGKQIGADFYIRETENPFKDFKSESQ